MRHYSIIYAALIVVFCVAGISAQKMLLNQAYLNEFPSVERVRTDMKGADDVDSEARFMAALDVLNDFMIRDLLRAPNGGMYNMPPAADKVHDRYRNAITKLVIDSPEPPSKDPRFRPLRDKYESDPAFADLLLLKFFTSQFRADYYAWTRKPMPASTAIKAAGGGVVGTPDPDVTRAKAAKVDIALFAGSIRFGDPLRLPQCPYEKGMLGQLELGYITQDCENIVPPSELADFAASLLQPMLPAGPGKPTPTPDPNLRYIILTEDHRPSWMSTGGNAGVRLNDSGGVERVVFTTRGRTVENNVAQDLKAKYGVAHYSDEGIITPDVGNAFKVHNLTWVLPGLHVEYQVIGVDNDGRVQIDGVGYVWVETESAYARRMAEEKKKKKRSSDRLLGILC